MLEDGIISPCLLIVLLTLQSQILPRFLDNRPLDLLSNARLQRVSGERQSLVSRGAVNLLKSFIPTTSAALLLEYEIIYSFI